LAAVLGTGELHDAGVIVFELAANAVVHAQTDFQVSVTGLPDRVRIGVQDASPTLPAVRGRPVMATGGRGLALVDAMSLRWGSESRRDGKVVWAELSRMNHSADVLR
jgi:hypothetical protein